MAGAIDIGSRLELFVDDGLIDHCHGGAMRRLHQPIAREAALITDQAWEGNGTSYVTVFQDDDGYRMYYRCWHLPKVGEPSSPCAIALALSDDGKHWRRPELGAQHNIVFRPQLPARCGEHGFSPFKDANPRCDPAARYKAVGAGATPRAGLYAVASPDGLHWAALSEQPILRDGAFDSQNLVFWDHVRGEYRAYFRDFRHPLTGRRDYREGFRCVRTSTSPDFVNWSDPQWLRFPGSPDEHLYTNQITPYPRAPHLFVGFPARYVERPWSPAIEALPELDQRRQRAAANERYGSALTDTLFMCSRDGVTFHRYGEAFIRPGLRHRGNWVYGDNFQNWGIVETDSDFPGGERELSFYVTENYWRDAGAIIRRHTLRLDGFVSIHAPMSGGECVTRPLTFSGNRLLLNLSTSAAGTLRIEVQDPAGQPLEGFTLAQSPAMFGDALEYEALWSAGTRLSTLAGRPVRLRFVLHDADLFAIRFAP